MKTVVIAVGKELLTGKTINSNLKDISMKLRQIGIDVNRSFVIDDQKEEYYKVLDFCDEDLIIFTGGLGPTIDDITRETVYEYFGVETVVSNEVLSIIKGYFDRANLTMKDTNNKQAIVPKESVILHNKLGTAPGVYFETSGKKIALLPGPPHEMNPMIDEVVNILSKDLDEVYYSEGFKMVGTGESHMEKALEGFYDRYPNVNVAPYANVGQLKYIFTSTNKQELQKCMRDFEDKFKSFIFGSLEDSLESVIVDMLKSNNQTVSFAESCTGGMVASSIVNVSGSSSVFNESFVTYHDNAKKKYLGVSSDTLESFGAVSEQCAKEMCEGLYNQTNADFCVSVTGIAGPTGGSEIKPVGLVYFGVHHNGKTSIYKRVFNGNRIMVRTRATIFALDMLRRAILDE